MNVIFVITMVFGSLAIVFGLYVAVLTELVLPIWSLVDLARSRESSGAKKVLWTLGLVLLWGPSAIIYGIVVSGNRKLRRQAIIAGCFGVVGILSYPFLQMKSDQQVARSATRAIAVVNEAKLIAVAERNRAQMVNDLANLQNKAIGPWFRTRKEKDRLEHFAQFAEALVADHSLSQAKFQDWSRYFDNRQIIDPLSFQKHVLELQGAGLKQPSPKWSPPPTENPASAYFGQKVDESLQKAALANLNVLRSALDIYKLDKKMYPSTLNALIASKILVSIPAVKIPPYHQFSSQVAYAKGSTDASDQGGWLYINAPTSAEFGQIHINCTHPAGDGKRWVEK
jgi:type II secretory pathway pseudopilin PulG